MVGHSLTYRLRLSSYPVALVVLATALLVLTGLVVPPPPSMAAPPPEFQKSLVVGDGLNGPAGFEIAPDGRIFVLERAGTIKIIKNGQLLQQPFAVLPAEPTGDRGLIGIAFDPDFGNTNHFVYLYYTGHDLLNHLVRFSAADDVGTDGPYPLFQTQSPSQLLHVGGTVGFGLDGKLYLAVGDNGSPAKAQQLDNPHGKILRINKDGSIPPDNPFYGQPGVLGSVWAYGFRNPWRFQFDSATGELYGGDVGDYSWEELNHIVRGGNYGWPIHEGPCTAGCAGYVDPIDAYPHNGESAAITGGPVYRSSMFPTDYQGSLFFGDYAKGFLKRAQLDATGQVTAVHDFDNQAGSVVDMKVAPDGSLYYLTYYPGALYRVSYNTTSHEPVANATSDLTKGVGPLQVHFSSVGSIDPDGDPLGYLWSFGDGTTSTEANPTKTYLDDGVYTARLTVSAGPDQTSAQPIVIQVGTAPTLTVAAPTDGALYRAGDTITYNAFATDAAGFDLDDGDIRTEVRLRHGSHYHPFVGPLIGRVGSFTIPTTGEASADTSYEITVTATDSTGLSSTKVVSIYPRTARVSLATQPAGLGLTLDGIPVSTPTTIQNVIGFQRELAAPTRAVGPDGTELHFAGWSDGRTIRHTVTVPDADATYTATYQPSPAFVGSYFDNQDLAGTPVLTRQDSAIDFNWADGAPDPALPANGFSIRWSKTQYFGGGRYRFTTVTDDGVRLYLDNRRVIDQWQGQPATEHTYVADLGTGNHTVTLEYFEGGGDALATLTWDSTPDQPDESFHAEYWNIPSGTNAIPATTPVLTRDEPAIDHDWGAGSPAATISADRFAARWTRTLSVAPGEYELVATADDGVRLTVDGVLVADGWVDQAPTSYPVRLPLDGGPHTILMEYYETGGGALARLTWSQVGDIPVSPAYQAEYWNTSGAAASAVIPTRSADLARSDAAVDFDWGSGAPDPLFDVNSFLARWTRTDVLSAGVYRFAGVSDDGIRVFVDNLPVIDEWQPRSAPYTVDKVVLGGPHVIRVEYFEGGGDARVSFGYQRISAVVPVDTGYTAEYFPGRDLSGAAVLTRQDASVDFDWGGGSPGDGLPVDDFSARWVRSVHVPDGTYAFTVTADDGVRLLVDGVVVLDRWVLQAPTTHTVTRQLSEGTHQIVLEYFEAGGGAVVRFDFQPTDAQPPPPGSPFAAVYFTNPDLTGDPVLTRGDDAIDFGWAAASPDSSVPVDSFSARWTRAETVEAGTYRLTATGDDGIRVLIDGNLVLDGWRDQPPTTYVADVVLAAGEHTVVVEFYERTGGATARFGMTRL
jgi:glucose/arabinose dehydrogenase